MKVKDLIKLLEKNGWRLVRTKGSHRIFHHPGKKKAVTVSGKLSVDMPKGTLHAILKDAELKTNRSPR